MTQTALLSGLADSVDRLRSLVRSGDARRGAKIVEIVLVAVLGILLARLVLSVLAPLPLPKGDIVAALPGAAQSTSSLQVRNPFPAAAIVIDEPVVNDVEETSLNLTLMGVYAEGDGSGSAVIKLPDGKQQRFTVDDQIVNGVTLENVYPDQIIINRGGIRESLRFERKLETTSPRPLQARPSQSLSGTAASAVSGQLATVLRLAPGQNSNGEPAILIYASSDRAAFARLGLKEGDVLHSIDGQTTPKSPSILAAMIARVQRQNSAKIEVERNGEIIPITITTGN